MAFDPSKDIIRTNAGDPIPQIWDDVQQKFVPYEGQVKISGSIASVGEYQNNLLLRSELPNYPYMPKINAKLEYLNKRVKWIDNKNQLWATVGGEIQKSTDKGENWETVITVDTEIDGEIYNRGLMVSDTGRIIIGTHEGTVLVTNEEQTSYSQAFSFSDDGQFAKHLGYTKFENIILIGGYNPDITDTSNEVYMSKDNGETWEKIFDETINAPENQNHIHDVEYDPYEDRIYVLRGDGSSENNNNTNIFYANFSDVSPGNWDKVYEDNDTNNIRLTQCIAYSHGIIFATDDGTPEIKEGLIYYPKPKNKIQAPIKKEDFIMNYYQIDPTSTTLRHYAVKSIKKYSKNKQITIIPFRAIENGLARLIASEDGLNWFEIWKNDKRSEVGFENILMDDENDLFAIFVDNSTESPKTFKSKFPDFIQHKQFNILNKIKDLESLLEENKEKRKKIISYEKTATSTMTHFAGQTFAQRDTNVLSLDISEYDSMITYIENTSDSELSGLRLFFTENSNENLDNAFFEVSLPNLTAGESVVITPEDYPVLKEGFLGYGVRLYMLDGQSAKIIHYGKK